LSGRARVDTPGVPATLAPYFSLKGHFGRMSYLESLTPVLRGVEHLEFCIQGFWGTPPGRHFLSFWDKKYLYSLREREIFFYLGSHFHTTLSSAISYELAKFFY